MLWFWGTVAVVVTLAVVAAWLYEVGVNEEQPDTVFVAELWTSADQLFARGGTNNGIPIKP